MPKIEPNIRRDRHADRRLRAHGVLRVRIWEHDLKRGGVVAAGKIERAIARARDSKAGSPFRGARSTVSNFTRGAFCAMISIARRARSRIRAISWASCCTFGANAPGAGPTSVRPFDVAGAGGVSAKSAAIRLPSSS